MKSRWLLIGLAVFALVWIVVRARSQSVVIDEADSYLAFVEPCWRVVAFSPSSANHVLHNLLVRFVTSSFGLSELTLRTPALTGGLIYICASLWLCTLLTKRVFLQALLFTCLVFNPLVLDLFVAAPGYSLAVGFLMAAFCMFAQTMLTSQAIPRSAILASARVWTRARCWCFFCGRPGVCEKAGLCWHALVSYQGCWWRVRDLRCTVAHLGKGDLSYGARSLAETWTSLVWASFYGLDLRAVRMFPILASITTKHVLALLPLVVTALLLADTLLMRFRNGLDDSQKRTAVSLEFCWRFPS